SSEEESRALPAAEDATTTSVILCIFRESARACALCNCVERSLHGQRELRHFGPSSDRPTLKPSASPLPQPGNDDLSSIGFSDSSCLAALFDDSGRIWNVLNNFFYFENMKIRALPCKSQSLVLFQLCEYCKRLGATIRCHAEGCSRFYHFPCSAASGSFQSMKQLALLCPEHIDKAEELAGEESWCAVCDSAGELTDLLFCTGCGLHYHAACLEIGATPIQRAGWQCPECKVCQTCRQPGEDSKMLVCDACDKGYHTFCLQPAMDSLPSDPWKCRRCRVCTECGVRGLVLPGSAQWFDNYAVCESCQRDRSSICGVCSKAANPSVQRYLVCMRLVIFFKLVCALHHDLPEVKCICLLCKEDQQHPVTQTYSAEIQTREVSEETGGHVDLVESTIQTDADMGTEEQTDLPDVTPCQKGASEVGQAELSELKETPMEMGKLDGTSCLDADEKRPVEVVSQMTQTTHSLDATAKTKSIKEEPIEVSQQDPEYMEVEKQEVDPSVKQEKSGSIPVSEPKLPASAASVEKTETVPMADQQEATPHQDAHSPPLSRLTLSVDTEEALSAGDMEARQLPHSEEDDEEEDDEQLKGDGQNEDIKQELHEVKPELLLDEMSNISHGDESSSGFLGSPGEPDPQLSMELGLVPSGHSHADNLQTETDDSLPFEPLKSDREKAKRRGSPGRSRVKQARDNFETTSTVEMNTFVIFKVI
uniref:MLL3 n=1 Tax=Sphaeramia orbicularis TaxID=375764 RepID=A0A672Y4F8_9TELE